MMTVQTIIVVHCANNTTHHTVMTTVHETSSRPGGRTTTTLVCMDSLWDITRFIAIIIIHQSSNNGNKLPLNWPHPTPAAAAAGGGGKSHHKDSITRRLSSRKIVEKHKTSVNSS